MAFPTPGQTIYGSWTQQEKNADTDLRFKHRGVSVKDAPFNAVGDGVADDTAAILAADAVAVTNGWDLWFPAGTYKTSQNLVISHVWRGSWNANNPGGTIIKPTSAVTKCFDIRSGGFVDGFFLNGVNTTNAFGIAIGTSGLVNLTVVQNTMVFSFVGATARGIEVQQLVTGNFTNVYCALNQIGLHCNGGNTPTDTIFLNCQFRQSITKGVWLETGYGLRFIKPLFESNGEEGLYMQNVAGTLTEVTIDDAWYELNWTSVASGAARHAKFNCFVDGANGPCGTIRFQHVCAKFLESATEARAIHLTNCTGFSDFSTKCSNEAGQIVVDGSSFGNFEGYQGMNGPFLTTVTNTSGGAWNSRSHLEDNIEALYTDWVPTITGGGAMTINTPVVIEARYKIVGKTLEIINLNVTFTTAGVANATVNLTLPTNVRVKNAFSYRSGGIVFDPGSLAAYAQGDGASPTSSIKINKVGDAVWGIGAGRQILFSGRFELF